MDKKNNNRQNNNNNNNKKNSNNNNNNNNNKNKKAFLINIIFSNKFLVNIGNKRSKMMILMRYSYVQPRQLKFQILNQKD